MCCSPIRMLGRHGSRRTTSTDADNDLRRWATSPTTAVLPLFSHLGNGHCSRSRWSSVASTCPHRNSEGLQTPHNHLLPNLLEHHRRVRARGPRCPPKPERPSWSPSEKVKVQLHAEQIEEKAWFWPFTPPQTSVVEVQCSPQPQPPVNETSVR